MMKLLDSNILIYATQAQYSRVADFLEHDHWAYSEISRIEVLGYHKLGPLQRAGYERLLAAMEALPVDSAVVDRAVNLRSGRRMGLGDSIIAATALQHRIDLVTHNTKDFSGIDGLTVIDPLAIQAP